MRICLASLLLVFLAACAPTPPQTRAAIAEWRSGEADPDCEIPGEAIQWQADYCMMETQTDDIIAAQPCMDRESSTRRGEECARRRFYKREWCRGLVANGAMQRSYAECIADPELAGPTVRRAEGE